MGLLASIGKVSGEGPVAPPDASLDIAADFGPVSAQANVTRVDDTIYVGLLGRNFEIDGAGDLAGVDISGAGRAVLSWADSPTDPVPDEIDGLPTLRISATIDPNAAIEDLGPLLASTGLSDGAKQQLRDGLTRGDIEIWVGQADLLPRRMTVDLTLDGEVDELQLAGLDLNAELNFTDYGEPGKVSAPANPQKVSLNDLGSLLGG